MNIKGKISLFFRINQMVANKAKLYVAESKIKNANYGVFVQTQCYADEIISLYPGEYYPPRPLSCVVTIDGSPIPHISDVILENFYNSNYKISLSDEYCASNGYIDALNCLNNKTMNPYAIAHLINHSKTKRNVKPLVFDWNEYKTYNNNVIPSELLKVNQLAIDKSWYIDHVSGEVVKIHENCADLKGIAFVSTRDINEGEELYLDYKFEKGNEPIWYVNE